MAQRECLASELGLRKIALQKKKSFKLKLRENSHKVMLDNCYKVAGGITGYGARGNDLFSFFFWRSAPFRAISHDFQRSLPGKVVISK